MIVKLSHLACGDFAEIFQEDSGMLPAKFYEMGLQPGARIRMKHKAPWNGPICVRILDNDSLVAVRKSEADRIKVRIISLASMSK